MLAPIDKLNSRVNDVMQIVVTTACTLQCSNCTQLLPFRKDYRHMGLDCFRAAVESLRDWPGVVGIFGGNPCNHPKFAEICKILTEVIPQQRRRGLWSNDLLSHGEIAKQTFYPEGRFNLNAHSIQGAAAKIETFLPGRLIAKSDTTQATHAAILIDRRDYGMPDADWVAARESCDINQKWSGAIVERDGAPFGYFCEVAAALDGIRGENHGVPAQAGWWKHSIGALGFQDQIRKCCDAGCGVPLRVFGRKDNEELFDISPSFAGFQNKRGVSVVRMELEKRVRESTDYMGVR